jgi:hypothetical protein
MNMNLIIMFFFFFFFIMGLIRVLSENWTSSYIINLIYLKCNPFSASMNLYMHSASI